MAKSKDKSRDLTTQVIELVRELAFDIPKDADAFDIAQRAAAYARVDKTQRASAQRDIISKYADTLLEEHRAKMSMLSNAE